jgi:hypothetical protein
MKSKLKTYIVEALYKDCGIQKIPTPAYSAEDARKYREFTDGKDLIEIKSIKEK